MTEPVQVVVVHWNQPEACLITVDRYRDQTVPVRVTVVDNGSRPEAVARLKTGLDDDVELVEVGHNSGFGPGANVGVARWLGTAGGEWVAVTPHDAEPAPDALERIVTGLVAEPDVGLVSADVGDGFTPIVQPYLGSIDAPQQVTEGFEEADYAHGTLLLMRRPCVEDIGLFDERYFAYCEEADLGLRARAAGWRVGVMRGAEVHNPVSETAHPTIDYLKERNTLLLIGAHHGPAQVAFRVAVAVAQLVAGLVAPTTRGHFFDGRARVWALADAARGRFGPPPAALVGRTNPDP